MSKTLHILGKTLFGVVFCCLFTACTSPQCGDRDIPELIPGKNLSDVDTSLRSGEPCAPPCWQGLIPGKSTDTDAIEVLDNLSFIRGDSVLRRDLRRDSGIPDWEQIGWHSSVSNSYGSVGFIRLNPEDKIVSITIDLEFELTLQELIDILGEPDAFSIFYSPPTCHEVSIVWLEAGLIAWPTIVSSPGDNPLISPQRTVTTVEYSTPASTLEEFLTTLGYENTESRDSVADLFAGWTGFDDVRLSTIYPED